MIGRVTLNGNRKPGVFTTTWRIGHAVAAGKRANVIEIMLELDPSQQPSPDGFALATHGDGTETRFDGSLELRDAAGAITYILSFEAGSLRKWNQTVSEQPGEPAREHWEIIAKKFGIAAAGDRVDFFPVAESRLQISG
jgi:hypothetical protein